MEGGERGRVMRGEGNERGKPHLDVTKLLHQAWHHTCCGLPAEHLGLHCQHTNHCKLGVHALEVAVLPAGLPGQDLAVQQGLNLPWRLALHKLHTCRRERERITEGE